MSPQILRELTVRAVVLGGLITLAFTAANVYLGLKIGLTFATSIPAAVISMAVLRLFKHSSLLENNIVQTVASAAGTLAAIIFVLPGLVMVGWWQGFPYWTTMSLTALGGILGVMFSVPLRRALVVDTDLPYPEGVAAAEVLLVGEQARDGNSESRRGLAVITLNSVVSGLFFALSQTGLVVNEADVFFRVGPASTGILAALSMAEIGAGHLVGIAVGVAMLVGVILGWWILLPILTAHSGLVGSAATVAESVFHSDVRFFGAGVIGTAALWTFARILGPILDGLRSALHAHSARTVHSAAPALTERDLPIQLVGAISLGTLALMAVLLWQFIAGGPLAAHAVPLIGTTVLYVFLAGVIIASICGYMAGLIGASNSPISGVGMLAVIGAALLVSIVAGFGLHGADTTARVAYALFATALVFGVATISNDNLQDLKTGQMVGATPWRQQIALVYGVIFGSLVIPPVLRLLNSAYGFAGTPGAGPHALPAPQAALISALAQGMFGGHLNLRMIGFGALAGGLFIAIDAALGRAGRTRLPTLAIGLGVYLPMSTSLAVVIGAIAGHCYDRWAARTTRPDFAKRMGVLMATGMIVGESLFGVVYAGIVVLTGNSAPFALIGDGFATPALIIGVAVFAALVAALYWRVGQTVRLGL